MQALAAAAARRPGTQLYWTARICLVRRHAELRRLRRRVRRGLRRRGARAWTRTPAASRSARRRRRRRPHLSVPRRPTTPRTGRRPALDDAAAGGRRRRGLATARSRVPERLPARAGRRSPTCRSSSSTPDEMDLLGRWLETAARTLADPAHAAARASTAAGHRIALRPTIARARRTGWEAVELVGAEPVDRPRRVVMLCDVSQSMQAQATAYLHLMRALAVTADAEVFAFATSLTRLTTVLAHRSAEVGDRRRPAPRSSTGSAAPGSRPTCSAARLASRRHACAARSSSSARTAGTATRPSELAARDGPAAPPRAPGDLDEPARGGARLRAAGRVDGRRAALLRRAAAGRHLRLAGRVVAEIARPTVSSRASRGSKAGTARR